MSDQKKIIAVYPSDTEMVFKDLSDDFERIVLDDSLSNDVRMITEPDVDNRPAAKRNDPDYNYYLARWWFF